jgi:hypothetical protein
MASKKRGCEQQQGEQQPNSFHQQHQVAKEHTEQSDR